MQSNMEADKIRMDQRAMEANPDMKFGGAQMILMEGDHKMAAEGEIGAAVEGGAGHGVKNAEGGAGEGRGLSRASTRGLDEIKKDWRDPSWKRASDASDWSLTGGKGAGRGPQSLHTKIQVAQERMHGGGLPSHFYADFFQKQTERELDKKYGRYGFGLDSNAMADIDKMFHTLDPDAILYPEDRYGSRLLNAAMALPSRKEIRKIVDPLNENEFGKNLTAIEKAHAQISIPDPLKDGEFLITNADGLNEPRMAHEEEQGQASSATGGAESSAKTAASGVTGASGEGGEEEAGGGE